MFLDANWRRELVYAARGRVSIGHGVEAYEASAMGDVLYKTSPRDPAVLLQTAVVLLLVAGVALVAPVVRALRLAPAAILRSE